MTFFKPPLKDNQNNNAVTLDGRPASDYAFATGTPRAFSITDQRLYVTPYPYLDIDTSNGHAWVEISDDAPYLDLSNDYNKNEIHIEAPTAAPVYIKMGCHDTGEYATITPTSISLNSNEISIDSGRLTFKDASTNWGAIGCSKVDFTTSGSIRIGVKDSILTSLSGTSISTFACDGINFGPSYEKIYIRQGSPYVVDFTSDAGQATLKTGTLLLNSLDGASSYPTLKLTYADEEYGAISTDVSKNMLLKTPNNLLVGESPSSDYKAFINAKSSNTNAIMGIQSNGSRGIQFETQTDGTTSQNNDFLMFGTRHSFEVYLDDKTPANSFLKLTSGADSETMSLKGSGLYYGTSTNKPGIKYSNNKWQLSHDGTSYTDFATSSGVSGSSFTFFNDQSKPVKFKKISGVYNRLVTMGLTITEDSSASAPTTAIEFYSNDKANNSFIYITGHETKGDYIHLYTDRLNKTSIESSYKNSDDTYYVNSSVILNNNFASFALECDDYSTDGDGTPTHAIYISANHATDSFITIDGHTVLTDKTYEFASVKVGFATTGPYLTTNANDDLLINSARYVYLPSGTNLKKVNDNDTSIFINTTGVDITNGYALIYNTVYPDGSGGQVELQSHYTTAVLYSNDTTGTEGNAELKLQDHTGTAHYYPTKINLNGKELKNDSGTLKWDANEMATTGYTGFCRWLGQATSDPSNPRGGDQYYNTSTSKARYYTGSAWIDLN